MLETKVHFGEIDVSASVFAETELFAAVYNLAPLLPGHTLILPKKRIPSIVDLDERQLSELPIFARKVSLFLVKHFSASGFDWLVQEGSTAGQTIDHLHLHIVPRREGDLPKPSDWYPKMIGAQEITPSTQRPKLSSSELADIVARLRVGWTGGA